MLALRLARGTHPLVLLRRLFVAAASAGVGFLLLCTLGHALSHPGQTSASLLRLLWCLAPLAATVQFAVAVARTDPSTRPRPGLSAVGLGPARLAATAAASTALSCTLGSMVALLVFLHLRGDLTGLPFDRAGTELLAADRPLPLAAVVILLSLAPLTASTASAWVLRPRGGTRGRRPVAPRGDGVRDTPAPPPASSTPHTTGTATLAPPTPLAASLVTSPPAGLPWGVALTAAGLAVETYASRGGGSGRVLPLPGHADLAPAGVLAGWSLTALGLALAGPGLVHLCGFLLQAVRPGAVRLLAGRVLQGEAGRIGRPLGVVCATASGLIAATTLYSRAPGPSFGPLTALGAALVLVCTTATLILVALETKQARTATTRALLRQGAAAQTLRAAALTRLVALITLFAPVTWALATLAAAPLAP
ncbi:hypothetical protein GCM10010329_55910 [Streptomyces spiroverticillatus]|uniref:Uncharacterized protein n=1 Tax=Streptomyces finlayi TaxID=67296 RepID=A0A918X2B7_9ACTN|nr:hypothetical protein [Streptomyces finlayi]GHA25363.1 hypothetical protein GCM10010329_55910 [Streptomyces spiroverticillatus]GHD05432.1 hypothetical protein GCM10010334_55900 [Streptomyces finlayi]